MTDDEAIDHVVSWMMEQIQSKNRLSQHSVVLYIKSSGRTNLLYKNGNGNWALDKKINDKFRKISGDSVVWIRSDQSWRARRPNDKPGRMQP